MPVKEQQLAALQTKPADPRAGTLHRPPSQSSWDPHPDVEVFMSFPLFFKEESFLKLV